MKNKIIALVAVGVISIGGLFSVGCSDKSVKDEANDQKPSGTSPMVKEQLAIIGNISEITKNDEGITMKVVGESNKDADYEEVYVRIHASTNIFNDNKDDLLQISDLKEGQMIKVYYDGTELENTEGHISGLRVLIVE